MRLLTNPGRTVLLWSVLCAAPAVWIIAGAYASSGQPPFLCQPECTWGDVAWVAAVPIVIAIAVIWWLGTLAIRWFWRQSNRPERRRRD